MGSRPPRDVLRGCQILVSKIAAGYLFPSHPFPFSSFPFVSRGSMAGSEHTMADMLLETLADEVDEKALVDLFGLDHPLFDTQAAESALQPLLTGTLHVPSSNISYDMLTATAALPRLKDVGRAPALNLPRLTLFSLPNELLEHIMSFLKRRYQSRVARVNRRLNEVVPPVMYRRLFIFLGSDTEIRPKWRSLLLPSNENLQYNEDLQLEPATSLHVSATVYQ